MKEESIPRSFGTHDGSFHADEVTACALLLLYQQIDYDKIVRTRNLSKLRQCEVVCDVGGIYDPQQKKFDHHQLSYEGDLSSAGMVLAFLKEEKVIDPATYDYFNHSLVLGIDAIDNGKIVPRIGLCSFSGVIANFVPARYDIKKEVMDCAFFKAVDFAIGHLERLVEKYQYMQKCRKQVEEEMKKNDLLLSFDVAIPWMESFFALGGDKHPALFIIMPSQNQWKLRGIPPSLDKKMEVRLSLPKEWGGISGEELQEKTNILGAVFCHKGLFISIWKTKKDALKAFHAVIKRKT